MVMEMNRDSLNSDGAFRTMIHSRIPHNRIISSTAPNQSRMQNIERTLLTDGEAVVPPVALAQKSLQVVRRLPDYHCNTPVQPPDLLAPGSHLF